MGQDSFAKWSQHLFHLYSPLYSNMKALLIIYYYPSLKRKLKIASILLMHPWG